MSSSAQRVRRWAGVCLDGIPFIVVPLAVGALFAWKGLSAWSAPPFLLAGFCAWFFRDPERTPPSDPAAIVSPADGTVVGVAKAPYPRMMSGEATRISIFMSVFNVHVNRIPCDGKIVEMAHNPGTYFAAYADKASELNEQATIRIDTDRGIPLLVVQIAGLIARRISCRVAPGDRLKRGERYGLIRFGSRCDVYVPESVEVRVKKGDRVRGGDSILGVFR